MCLSDFLRSQFGSPSGPFGSLFVAPFLNFTNMNFIRYSIELLDPEPDDRVLDIGFGGGYSLLVLAMRTPKGRVAGVDRSPDMVSAAMFDKVLCVNTIYYWPDLGAALGEIARVLKPGGRLAVAFRSPESLRLVTLAWDNFVRYQPEEVSEAMRKAGFRGLRVTHENPWRIPDNLVLIGERKKRAPRQQGRKAAAVAS
jgi:SAM-dependent methyltransferase